MAARMLVYMSSYDHEAALAECLDRLAPMLPSDAVVAVWDDGSRDGTSRLLRERFPFVLVHGDGNRHGVARGRNEVLRRENWQKYDLLWCLDADALPTPACLSALLAALRDAPDAAAVAPVLTWAQRPDRLWSAGLTVSYGEAVCKDPWRDRLVTSLPGSPWPVDAAVTNGLLIRREALEKVGLYDESYFFVLSEVDLCLRLAKEWGPVLVVPTAVLAHDASGSLGGAYSIQRGYHAGWSAQHFLHRHGSTLQKLRFVCFFTAALVAGSVRQLLTGGPPTPWWKLRGLVDGLRGRRCPPPEASP